jgi:hypothetical protein
MSSGKILPSLARMRVDSLKRWVKTDVFSLPYFHMMVMLL